MNEQKLFEISLTKLIPHPLNPNELNEQYLEKLKNNIANTGNYPALIVRKINGEYQIIDGYHRHLVLQELGYKTAKCEVWDVDDKQALVLLSTLNRLRGADDIEKRSRLLKEMVDVYPDVDFIDWVPESPSSISALLQVVDGNVEQTLEVEQGLIEETLILNSVDPDKAKRIADLYKPPGTHYLIKFVISKNEDYNRLITFFGNKPSTQKLLTIIDFYEKENKGRSKRKY